MASTFMELLISQVENCRMLWDMRHKNYHNRLLVDREWNRIAADLRETKDTVKNKWKNLRDKFKKECNKIPRGRSGDSGDHASLYAGSWPYFESLLFLRAIVTPKETEGNITPSLPMTQATVNEDEVLLETSESQELEPSQNTQPSFQQDLQSPVPSPTSLSSPMSQQAQPPQKKTKITTSTRLQKEQEDFENSLPSKNTKKNPITITPFRKHTPQERDKLEKELLELEKKKLSLLEQQNNLEDDEDLNFFKSLIPHVRQLPSINKLYFRNQVQSCLMNELSKIQYNEKFSASRNLSSAASTVSNTFSLPSPVLPGTSAQEFCEYQNFSTDYNSPQDQSSFA